VSVVNAHGTSPPGRPRSERADRAILESTLEVLRTVGYARLTVEAVAAAAGVGKTTVYRRYADKAELVAAAIAAVAVVPEIPDSGDTKSDVLAVVETFRRRVLEDLGVGVVGSIMTEESHHPELVALLRSRVVEPRRAVLRRVLERGRERGDVRADVDCETVVEAVIGGLLMRRLLGGAVTSDDTARFVDTLWPAWAPG